MCAVDRMGWRSWNAFHEHISQPVLTQVIDALVAKNRTVKGESGPVSLAELGYASFGIDEGWAQCGVGQHDKSGNPTINETRFPNLTALVEHAHKRNLTAEWYMNGCGCVGVDNNPGSLQNYQGDVAAIRRHGFDGVKFDGCGRNENLTLYAELLHASVDPSRPNYGEVLIENCHWGLCAETKMGPSGALSPSHNYMRGRDNASCPTLDFCPYNTYRISGDINNSSGILPDPCHKLVQSHRSRLDDLSESLTVSILS
eukprot:COSAG02_NODE_1604_length_11728_cov_42.819417_8_plen_257_part_00